MDRRNFIKAGVAATGAAMLSGVTGAAEPIIRNISNKENEYMRIVVLTGSPRKNGNTNYLADRFIEGAREAGHTVYRFNAATSDVHPCKACNHCGMNGPCVIDDDYTKLCRPELEKADMVVLCTPMYYFGISAQLKMVIDRWYAANGTLHRYKKCAFIMAYANISDEDAAPMIAHYKRLCSYMGWEDVGMVIAPGVWTAGSVKNTKYPDQAYQLGRSLK